MNNQDSFLYKELCYTIIGCLYNVRNSYGSGQKELVYQNALAEQFEVSKLLHAREVSIPIKSTITNKTLGTYRLDFVVEDKVIVEVKAVKFTPRKMEQQLYSYLRSTKYEVGYLVNFGSTDLYFQRILLTNDRKMIQT